MLANYPKIMPSPMCQHGDKNTIPEEISQDAGLFSYTNGFPFITQIDIKAGGKAPERKDFNGILNEITQHIFYMQCGGQYLWNKELDYQVGALVFGSDKKMYKALQVSGKKQNAGAKDPINTANAAYWELFDTKELIALHNNDQNAHKTLFDKIKKQINNVSKISLANVITPSDTTKAVTGKAVADYAVGKNVNNKMTGGNEFVHGKLCLRVNNYVDGGANPTKDDYAYFSFRDKRGFDFATDLKNNLGGVGGFVRTTGERNAYIEAYFSKTSDGNVGSARLGIAMMPNKDMWAYCPTPKNNQIGNYIATTKWVRDNVPVLSGAIPKKLAERTTSGDWTLSKLTVGKPLKIYSILGVGNNNVANISVKSGADTGKGTYALGNEYSPLWLYKSTNIFEIIPTSTTVILSVSASTSNKLVAYQ